MASPAHASPDLLPTRVIIVHGFRAHVDAHWFPWLRSALADRGIDAMSVDLPLADSPNAADWEREVSLALGTPDEKTWIVGHSLAVWGARVDPQFMQVIARHIKHRQLLDV